MSIGPVHKQTENGSQRKSTCLRKQIRSRSKGFKVAQPSIWAEWSASHEELDGDAIY